MPPDTPPSSNGRTSSARRLASGHGLRGPSPRCARSFTPSDPPPPPHPPPTSSRPHWGHISRAATYYRAHNIRGKRRFKKPLNFPYFPSPKSFWNLSRIPLILPILPIDHDSARRVPPSPAGPACRAGCCRDAPRSERSCRTRVPAEVCVLPRARRGCRRQRRHTRDPGPGMIAPHRCPAPGGGRVYRPDPALPARGGGDKGPCRP